MEPTTQQAFDIGRPTTGQPAHHRTRNVIIVISVITIIIGVIYILIAIKERHDYNNYLKTAAGQLEMLERTSKPVTATPSERAAELEAMQKSSGTVTVDREDRINDLKALETQQ